MPSWFDIRGLQNDVYTKEEDEAGLEKSSAKICELIDQELAKNPHLTEKDVILGGVSQGGALALYAGLTRIRNGATPLGGIIALSTWLPLKDQFLKDDKKILKELRDTKVFQGHGDADLLVPFQVGQLASDILKETNLSSEFKSYGGMGHKFGDHEMEDMMNDVRKFIKEFVGDTSQKICNIL